MRKQDPWTVEFVYILWSAGMAVGVNNGEEGGLNNLVNIVAPILP